MSRCVQVRLREQASEDYVRALYDLGAGAGASVSTNALAARLGVTAGSASAMVKRLAERGLVVHRPYRGASLTAAGTAAALEVVRHHRLLETFLVQELGMAWELVHDEADVLEHVISEELEALIAVKLGHPARDPHGDPIPTVELGVETLPTVALGTLPEGAHARLVRVSDGDPEMLRYLGARGIAPGDALQVIERQPFGGPLLVRFASGTHALGTVLTDALHVTTFPTDGEHR